MRWRMRAPTAIVSDRRLSDDWRSVGGVADALFGFQRRKDARRLYRQALQGGSTYEAISATKACMQAPSHVELFPLVPHS